ncbi:MAG: hypothetical protein CMC88_00360 [Flavobacteriaceae bacterium]|nr:hypothetical protein [Flavobacteriaceae bacterium]|tara:strand:+ start:72582 stop:72845 length:264 start_codon:yes stop_codon:yes gene_type:complete
MIEAIKELPELYKRLNSTQKLDYLVKLTLYMTTRIIEKHLIDETEILEPQLFIENTMVVTDEKYKEMEEEGRIDKDGNIIPQMLPNS